MAPTAQGDKSRKPTRRGKPPGATKPNRAAKKPAASPGRTTLVEIQGKSRKRAKFAVSVDLAVRLTHALEALDANGVLAGTKSRKISARVDPGLVAEAKRKTGIKSDADVITAALAIMTANDEFGAWLVSQATPFPEDFELAL